MTCELHLSPWLKSVLTWLTLNGEYLIHLEHRVWKLVKVSASHDVDACVSKANLNGLEVVREVGKCLNGIRCHVLSLSIVEVEPL